MRNLLKNAIPFLVLGLFFLMAALLPELLGEGLKDWCERKLGVNWPIIVLVLFLVVAMVAIKYKPDLLGDLLPNKKADGTPPKPEDISDFYPKIKEYLRSRYQSRIDQKLAWRQPVNLRHRSVGHF